jgi:hypothetical protein
MPCKAAASLWPAPSLSWCSACARRCICATGLRSSRYEAAEPPRPPPWLGRRARSARLQLAPPIPASAPPQPDPSSRPELHGGHDLHSPRYKMLQFTALPPNEISPNLFILTLFWFVPIALVSFRRTLCSSTNIFMSHVFLYTAKY